MNARIKAHTQASDALMAAGKLVIDSIPVGQGYAHGQHLRDFEQLWAMARRHRLKAAQLDELRST